MRNIPLVLIVFAIGCNTPTAGHSGGGGSGGTGGGGTGGTGGGGTGGTGGGGSGGGGGTTDNCPPEAKLVYTIDRNRVFSSFQPNQKDVTMSTFTTIATLNCPTKILGGPFSMSVDRSGTAWVEYVATSGLTGTYKGSEIFKVSTKDGTCTATNFVSGQQGMQTFGMGFVANAPMSNQETLFIGGGPAADASGMSSATYLGTFDTTSLMIAKGQSINGRPELTGTGDAKLWGFFPDANMPRISQLDKAAAAPGAMVANVESNTIMLQNLRGMPTAWAFAFWGGDFWVFLEKDLEQTTTVYHVKGSDGSVTSWTTPNLSIVGAGVSTCAPTVPIS